MEYILKNYLCEIAADELDFVNQTAILGESDDYIEHEEIIKHNGNHWYWGEAEPMEIDAMIKQLTEIKEMGATHVEVMAHCDHHGYYFNGLEMRKATQEEIDEHFGLHEKEEEEKKQKEIERLEKKLKQLKEK